jgi:enoyl-[acyl-carrier protein] reductase I
MNDRLGVNHDLDRVEVNVEEQVGFDDFEAVWASRSPLTWDLDDPTPAARACVALLSDWFPATTGEIIHVDGGVHSQGA